MIAIASSYFKDGQNINFSIPITYIKDKIHIKNQTLLNDIEDPDLALNNIFLTIFDRIYYGMPEEEFLDALQGCKHIQHERKNLNLKPIHPESHNENTHLNGGFFEAMDEILGDQSIYKIDNVKIFDINFDFTFTFSEKEKNTLNSIHAESENSINSKYCYTSLTGYFSNKLTKFKKITENEHKQIHNNSLMQFSDKGYEQFFVKSCDTKQTSWIIYDSILSITLIDSQNNNIIRISWIENIFD